MMPRQYWVTVLLCVMLMAVSVAVLAVCGLIVAARITQ